MQSSVINDTLQLELRERFNPEGSELRRLQLRLLDMLKVLDNICSDNGITYWLSSGTCLGAVRHGGFIPWDDDVDIEMLEKDYRKLLKVMGTEPKDGFVLQTHRNDPTYILTHAKFRDLGSELEELSSYDRSLRYRGAFIDVFHLIPSSSKRLHSIGAFITRKAYRFAGLSTPAARLFNGLHRVLRATLLPSLGVCGRIGAVKRLRHETGSLFQASRCLDDLLPTVRIPFEGLMLPVPANADAYLRRIYGDYTRLPDPDSIQVHFSKIRFK